MLQGLLDALYRAGPGQPAPARPPAAPAPRPYGVPASQRALKHRRVPIASGIRYASFPRPAITGSAPSDRKCPQPARHHAAVHTNAVALERQEESTLRSTTIMRTFCGPLLAVACACSGASATQLRGSIHQALAGTSMAPEDTTEAITEFSREHCPEQLDACEKSSDCLPQIGGSKVPESAVANALYACFVKATSAEFSNGTSAELSNGTEALLETSSGLQAHADLASCSFDRSTVAACTSGYKNMGLTCFRGAHLTGKSRSWCRGNCPLDTPTWAATAIAGHTRWA
jgi:hypothetical protein